MTPAIVASRIHGARLILAAGSWASYHPHGCVHLRRTRLTISAAALHAELQNTRDELYPAEDLVEGAVRTAREKANAAPFVEAMARVSWPRTARERFATAFFIMQLKEAAMRVALALGERDGATAIETYKRMPRASCRARNDVSRERAMRSSSRCPSWDATPPHACEYCVPGTSGSTNSATRATRCL